MAASGAGAPQPAVAAPVTGAPQRTYSPMPGCDWHTLTADLSPYVGNTIFIAYRHVTGVIINFGSLDKFNVIC